MHTVGSHEFCKPDDVIIIILYSNELNNNNRQPDDVNTSASSIIHHPSSQQTVMIQMPRMRMTRIQKPQIKHCHDTWFLSVVVVVVAAAAAVLICSITLVESRGMDACTTSSSSSSSSSSFIYPFSNPKATYPIVSRGHAYHKSLSLHHAMHKSTFQSAPQKKAHSDIISLSSVTNNSSNSSNSSGSSGSSSTSSAVTQNGRNDDDDDDDYNNQKGGIMINDVMTITKHLSFCLLLSFILALYEGYDCTFLKPLPATIRQFPPTIALSSNININSNISNNNQNNIDFKASMPSSGIQQDIIQLMKSGTRGMGRGKIDRMDGWFQATYYGQDNNDYGDDSTDTDTATVSNTNADDGMIASSSYSAATSMKNINALRNIQSYNEVMQYHRENRVPRWKDDGSALNRLIISSSSSSSNVELIQNAIGTIYQLLFQLEELKNLANDYDLDAMVTILQSDLFKRDLEISCNILHSSVQYIDYDARQEIGFDWGRYEFLFCCHDFCWI